MLNRLQLETIQTPTASAIKAKLLIKTVRTPLAPISPAKENFSSRLQREETPKQERRFHFTQHKNSDPEYAMHTVVWKLCAEEKQDQAREVLFRLAQTRPSVLKCALFWKSLLRIERDNECGQQRTHQTFQMALEHCIEEGERREIVELLVHHFQQVEAYSGDVFSFLTPSAPAAQPPPPPTNEMDDLCTRTANGLVLQEPAQLMSEEWERFPHREEDEFFSNNNENVEWDHPLEFHSPQSHLKHFFSSPAIRVISEDECSVALKKNNGRLSLLAKSAPAETSSSSEGLIVVLSPVKQKNGVKVATPVRRSARKSEISNVMEHNREVLGKVDFSYLPNKSLVHQEDAEVSNLETIRSSKRKRKPIDRFVPM